jgi:hypothetical protein
MWQQRARRAGAIGEGVSERVANARKGNQRARAPEKTPNILREHPLQHQHTHGASPRFGQRRRLCLKSPPEGLHPALARTRNTGKHGHALPSSGSPDTECAHCWRGVHAPNSHVLALRNSCRCHLPALTNRSQGSGLFFFKKCPLWRERRSQEWPEAPWRKARHGGACCTSPPRCLSVGPL